MQQGLAPETLAAQALGDVDPVARARTTDSSIDHLRARPR